MSIKDKMRMRRFTVSRDGAVIGRGVSFPDDIIGLRWRGEARMTLVWMGDAAFTDALATAGADVTWLDTR